MDKLLYSLILTPFIKEQLWLYFSKVKLDFLELEHHRDDLLQLSDFTSEETFRKLNDLSNVT